MLRAKRLVTGFVCTIFVALHIFAVARISGVPLLAAPYQGGWTPTQEQHKVSWEAQEWAGAGEGQTRLLYKDYEIVHGHPYVPRDQGSSPSCVAQAAAAAVDILAAVEIRSGEPEQVPPADADVGTIYGFSRVEIGGLQPNSGPGAFNIWACWALKQYGSVPQLNYPLLGYDLRRPDATREYQFGETGVPIGLELIAKFHPIREYIPITSYEECRDAIFMGCPVIVGSTQGFGDGQLRRDREGFLNPPHNRWWPSIWNHSMCIIGVADVDRKGCLLLNSWGSDWISGPKRFDDEPAGTFWVDAHIINQMLKEGDSFAFKSFKGYARYQLWLPLR